MKALSICIICCFISIGCLAQKSDTLVTYSFGGSSAKKENVSVYKINRRDTIAWVKTTADKNFVLLKKETFADEQLTVHNGSYQEFLNGKLFIHGHYDKNAKTGKWIIYDSLGYTAQEIHFLNNKFDGPFKSFWDKDHIKDQGYFSRGLKTDEWKIFYANQQLAAKELYNTTGDLTDSAYFDENGQPTVKKNILTEPIFKGGYPRFYKFLAKTLRFPDPDLTGRVVCSVTVNTDGRLSNIEIFSSSHDSLSQEAIRVLKLSPPWLPGTLFGEPMAVQIKIAINFTIN
jgi:antitoxin component YwqK of YwqJK toxin-antitoxin module